MSSHREAPEIAKDPVADNTDVYAFVSPDRPETVTLIANYIPLQEPAGGPNFYEFGDDVLYEIHIDNDGDALADITYQFRFETEVRNPDTFLYNTGPITALDSPNWNRRQFYTVTRLEEDGTSKVLGRHLACPPCNIGPLSTPHYEELAKAAIHQLPGGGQVFAGQRNEGFYVDLGAIFDLLDIRPLQNLHLFPRPPQPGVDATKDLNVHSIALQVPKSSLTREGYAAADHKNPRSVIGVWASASRQKVTLHDHEQEPAHTGPWVQVSRLGNPLFNEVIVPLGQKNLWNRLAPKDDAAFVKYVEHPEVARLLPVLYPGVFPHLQALTAPRADLVAILLTGIPAGLIDGFQNFTGSKPADLLRLNVAIPPSSKPNIFGILGGDLAGFPNGRRVFDDVVTIELRAVAGATYPLIDHNYTPDAAVSKLTGGVPPRTNYLKHFPYLATPKSGFDVPAS
ncbi:DUF4331 domain-containing protein [Thermogemmatispora tikiterensis]|uniref:DUF4331 domain-containing protein n=1 Tax=Thermogemmatispora tikiterensis TaxID=1825093 RepID=A0A328VKF7_9CHLR|nr:DUF4331 domain-containing protein [Thermogemmatispora tikiterensis]RAQ98176.1 hypothetical protein A4R35_21725 [Thermogemmatispora tikiterensis]